MHVIFSKGLFHSNIVERSNTEYNKDQRAYIYYIYVYNFCTCVVYLCVQIMYTFIYIYNTYITHIYCNSERRPLFMTITPIFWSRGIKWIII